MTEPAFLNCFPLIKITKKFWPFSSSSHFLSILIKPSWENAVSEVGERWWWLPPYSALPCFYSNSFTSPLFLLDRDFLREKITESREAKDRLLPLERATINSSVCPLRRFWLSFSSSLFLQSLLISWFEEKGGFNIFGDLFFGLRTECKGDYW